jgi:hypothetical protein
LPGQGAQTGVQPTADGYVVEYKVQGPDREVEFDNFTHRGDPPVEVYQEYKGDYGFVFKGTFKSPEAQALDWVDQALAQKKAIESVAGPDAILETFISTPDMLPYFEEALKEARLTVGDDIHVYVVPLRK